MCVARRRIPPHCPALHPPCFGWALLCKLDGKPACLVTAARSRQVCARRPTGVCIKLTAYKGDGLMPGRQPGLRAEALLGRATHRQGRPTNRQETKQKTIKNPATRQNRRVPRQGRRAKPRRSGG